MKEWKCKFTGFVDNLQVKRRRTNPLMPTPKKIIPNKKNGVDVPRPN